MLVIRSYVILNEYSNTSPNELSVYRQSTIRSAKKQIHTSYLYMNPFDLNPRPPYALGIGGLSYSVTRSFLSPESVVDVDLTLVLVDNSVRFT